jgi:hypothetical protein
VNFLVGRSAVLNGTTGSRNFLHATSLTYTISDESNSFSLRPTVVEICAVFSGENDKIVFPLSKIYNFWPNEFKIDTHATGCISYAHFKFRDDRIKIAPLAAILRLFQSVGPIPEIVWPTCLVFGVYVDLVMLYKKCVYSFSLFPFVLEL